jgi:hypothetical protein
MLGILFRLGAVGIILFLCWGTIRSALAPFFTQPANISSKIIEIRKRSELATASTTSRVTVQEEHQSTNTVANALDSLGFRTGRSRISLSVNVTVKAGVNLEKAEVQGNTIVLPSPQILDAFVDTKTISVGWVEKGVLADETHKLTLPAQNEARAQGIVDACTNNVLGKAEEQALSTVRRLVPEAVVKVEKGQNSTCRKVNSSTED